MDYLRERVLHYDDTLVLASATHGGDSRSAVPTPYPDKDYEGEWEFYNVHVDSHVDVRQSKSRLRRYLQVVPLRQRCSAGKCA